MTYATINKLKLYGNWIAIASAIAIKDYQLNMGQGTCVGRVRR